MDRALVPARRIGPLLLLGMLAAASLTAQTAISADGIIESTAGGFKFPDGSLQATASAPGALPDTGQQECWDEDGDSISCSGTGMDGELQKGAAWPAPRFTDTGNGTVTDNLTGLIWLKDANCFTTGKGWTEALSDANGLMSGSCGLNDGSLPTHWRLPNVRELLSLVDYGEWSPVLPLGHPFVNVQIVANYWSSTTSLTAFERMAFVLNMLNGRVSIFSKTAQSAFVWPVRSAQ